MEELRADVDFDSAIYKLAKDIASTANADLNNAISTLRDELRTLHNEHRELQLVLAKHQDLIDLVNHLEGQSTKAAFLYREQDQIQLQMLDELCRQLGENYNVGAFQKEDRNQRIKNLVRVALKFVSTDAVDLFIAFASEFPYVEE